MSTSDPEDVSGFVAGESLAAVRRVAGGPGLPTGFPFSLAAVAGRSCFISGMPALDESGSFRAGSFVDEADRAWRNVEAIAAEAGFTAADIIFVQCVLADMGDYDALNGWWRGVYPDAAKAPARFTFQAGALPFGAKVELQAVAAKGA